MFYWSFQPLITDGIKKINEKTTESWKVAAPSSGHTPHHLGEDDPWGPPADLLHCLNQKPRFWSYCVWEYKMLLWFSALTWTPYMSTCIRSRSHSLWLRFSTTLFLSFFYLSLYFIPWFTADPLCSVVCAISARHIEKNTWAIQCFPLWSSWDGRHNYMDKRIGLSEHYCVIDTAFKYIDFIM